MTPSRKCLDLICAFEGYSDKAYKCSAGVWTIGFGTTKYPNGMAVKKGDICTNGQALIWLAFEVNEKSAYLNHVLGTEQLELEQNEYDAIVSLIYNCGAGILKEGRTMGDALRSKDKEKIADAFLVYCKITKLGIKITSKGLLNRRKQERDLFLGKI